MKINWKIRFKNHAFWVAFVPAVLLVIQCVAALFGFTIDLGEIGNRLIEVVNSVFGVLVLLGIVNDPTTPGINDSSRALKRGKLGDV